MSKLSVLFVLVALFQLALSASVSISSPKPNQKIELGETFEIKWSVSEKVEHHFEYVTIALASGPAQALIIDHVIANKVPAKDGVYKWKVPTDLPPKKNYVIEIGPSGNDIAFAGFVSIVKPASHSSSSVKKIHSSASPKATASVSVPVRGKPKQHANESDSSSVAPVTKSHSKAHSKAAVKSKAPKSAAPASATPTPSPATPVALICLAYPPQSEGATSSTTCRPLSSYTQYNFESIALRPKKHGSHKRKAAASSKHVKSSVTTTTSPVATPTASH